MAERGYFHGVLVHTEFMKTKARSTDEVFCFFFNPQCLNTQLFE